MKSKQQSNSEVKGGSSKIDRKAEIERLISIQDRVRLMPKDFKYDIEELGEIWEK